MNKTAKKRPEWNKNSKQLQFSESLAIKYTNQALKVKLTISPDGLLSNGFCFVNLSELK